MWSSNSTFGPAVSPASHGRGQSWTGQQVGQPRVTMEGVLAWLGCAGLGARNSTGDDGGLDGSGWRRKKRES
ncbi:hypothetical protein NL676_039216 [Syzygium grande]|nr:hypothetical protein NL676_039216 [Syzygium grande]